MCLVWCVCVCACVRVCVYVSRPHQPNVAKNETIDRVLTRARAADGGDEFDDEVGCELSEGGDNYDDEEKRHDGDSD